jgi:DNA sulfur modification protein DndB
MGNKTLIPAFQCGVGDLRYYVCKMKSAEFVRRTGYMHELGANQDLKLLIEQQLFSRSKAITEYLLKSKHRFLGGIVVAAWGGEPKYTAMSMEDPDGMLQGLDREFGVLTFDGSQQYFPSRPGRPRTSRWMRMTASRF